MTEISKANINKIVKALKEIQGTALGDTPPWPAKAIRIYGLADRCLEALGKPTSMKKKP